VAALQRLAGHLADRRRRQARRVAAGVVRFRAVRDGISPR